MLYKCLLLTAVCSLCLADHHWKRYKEEHGKDYKSDKVEQERRSHFELNKARVSGHNEKASEGVHTYNLSLNHLADIPPKIHLTRSLTGLLGSIHSKDDILGNLRAEGPIPDEIDWRKEGFRTPGWNQQSCGSCYAFTMASAVQAQVFRNNGSLEELSQQQLVDCSVMFGNLGCQGGSFRNTVKYLQKYGLLSSDDYPRHYQAKQSVCRAIRPKTDSGFKVKSWGVVPYQDEKALQVAVATVGPVAVSLDASRYTFQLYHSGVYDDPLCTGDNLNHAMLIVGYTKNYWILKNWWSSKWGQGGYMKLRRGVNRCGIANYAVYLTVQ